MRRLIEAILADAPHEWGEALEAALADADAALTCYPALAADRAQPVNDPTVDRSVKRRRENALAMLNEEPSREIAVIAEAGDPAHVAVALRGGAVGEFEIPAERYDGFALLALMQQHGHA